MPRELLPDEEHCPACGGTGEEWRWADDAPGEKAVLVGQCHSCEGFGTVPKGYATRAAR